MIEVSIDKDLEGNIKSLTISGHAGYGEYGQDIVCSAVSVLAINLVNSIEEFTDDKFELDMDDGYFKLILNSGLSTSSKLLLDSCILGIKSIKKQYGNNYIKIKFQEVK